MKKILLLVILTTWQLLALDKVSTVKIYHHLFHSMSKQATIKIYTEDKEYISIFSDADDFHVVSEAENADIVLVTSQDEIERLRKKEFPATTIFFATKYRLLKSYDAIVGAFYWKKGRSQLLFIRERLQNHHIKLSNSYSKFIIEKL